MGIVIAARFSGQDEASTASQTLQNAGKGTDAISTFFMNPSGQHDVYAWGGDCKSSPSASTGGRGAAVGAAEGGVLGAVAGIAGVPVIGPLAPMMGASLGAYVGSMVGAMASLKECGDTSVDNDYVGMERPSGMFVAVQTDGDLDEACVIAILRDCQGTGIERGIGHIVGGNWIDFDPLSTPCVIDGSTSK